MVDDRFKRLRPTFFWGFLIEKSWPQQFLSRKTEYGGATIRQKIVLKSALIFYLI
jgi:hypothetical protein